MANTKETCILQSHTQQVRYKIWGFMSLLIHQSIITIPEVGS